MANPDKLQAQWENELRRKLDAIRSEAMELAATLEFTGASDIENHALHQFAVETINKAEYFMSNPKGELDYPAKD